MKRSPQSKFLFSAHQCHYEQFGDLHGNVNVSGTEYKLELNVMRDHTHGSKRDWRLMHRYGIQNFTTKNGFRQVTPKFLPFHNGRYLVFL